MKAHLVEHVEGVRGTMFRDATQKATNALNATLDELESAVEKRVEETLALINRDYGALLADQNIFKALSTAREEIRHLLSQVDDRFDRALQSPDEPAGCVKAEDRTTMNVGPVVPVPVQQSVPGVSASGPDTPAAADAGHGISTATFANNDERTKVEPTADAASGEDVPMRDA